jgi:hypothetical protein
MDRNYPGPCSGCCTCPGPSFFARIRSASKSKCGLVDPTQANKFFLASVRNVTTTASCQGEASGSSFSDSVSCQENSAFTIYTTVNPSTCASTCTGEGSGTTTTSGTSVNTEDGQTLTSSSTTTETDTLTVVNCANLIWQVSTTSTSSQTDASGNTTSNTSTTSTEVNGGYGSQTFCQCNNQTTSSGPTISDVTTYGSEYDTSQLQAATVDALPSWPSTFGSNPTASAELSSTETSYSIEQCQYYLAHPVPPFPQLVYNWVERFIPDPVNGVAQAPIDTARTYTWDGSIPAGYNPSDNTTWPKSGIFEMDQPSGNGIVTIVETSMICGGVTTTLSS